MKEIPLSKVIAQILIWFFVWLLVSFLVNNAMEAPYRFIQQGLLSLIGIVLIICVNMYGLLPKLYFGQRTLFFIVAGVVLIYLTRELIYLDGSPWKAWLSPGKLGSKLPAKPPEKRMNIIIETTRYLNQIMPLLIAFLGNSLWIIAEYGRLKEKELAAIAKEKLEADIKFLKFQVNPHFLFNALNNIYSLSVLKSEKTPESLLSLSQMLRYMLYESDFEKVTLQKEIDYIQHFVSLQLLKDSRGLNIELDTSQANPEVLISPLLFIPFLENAFKHSHVEDLDTGFIRINLQTNTEKVILEITNSVPQKTINKDTVGGIGLENVKNRLELLYPGSYDLNVQKREDTYSVNLSIEV